MPPITALNPLGEQLGKKAVSKLIEMLEKQEPTGPVLIQPQLQVRASTSRIPLSTQAVRPRRSALILAADHETPALQWFVERDAGGGSDVVRADLVLDATAMPSTRGDQSAAAAKSATRAAFVIRQLRLRLRPEVGLLHGFAVFVHPCGFDIAARSMQIFAKP